MVPSSEGEHPRKAKRGRRVLVGEGEHRPPHGREVCSGADLSCGASSRHPLGCRQGERPSEPAWVSRCWQGQDLFRVRWNLQVSVETAVECLSPGRGRKDAQGLCSGPGVGASSTHVLTATPPTPSPPWRPGRSLFLRRVPSVPSTGKA